MAPPTANAHVRTGVVAVDYRATVIPEPARLRAAADVRVYKTDQAIGLAVRRGHVVVVLGYVGEPFLRIDAAGTAVNASSPTAAAVGLLPRSRPSGGVMPGWHLRSSRRSAIWHDARVRGLPSGIRRRLWSVPLVVDGRRVRLEGLIWRVPAPSPWPWLVLAMPLVVLAGVVVRRRSLLRRAAVGLGTLCVVTTILTAAVFALASTASAGKWIEGANEVMFALVGLAVVVRGSADARPIAGGALGLLALWAGLSKVPVFLHGVVLSSLPATPTRALVALTISAGAAATVVGLAVFFELLEAHEEPSLTYRHLRRPS
jgi:hypothetical protein